MFQDAEHCGKTVTDWKTFPDGLTHTRVVFVVGTELKKELADITSSLIRPSKTPEA
jgi:hypothetical protein